METNEIMTNEVVDEVIEEVVVDNPNRGTAILGTAAVVAGIGVGVWALVKKVIPAVKKRRAEKKKAKTNRETEAPIEVEFKDKNETA